MLWLVEGGIHDMNDSVVCPIPCSLVVTIHKTKLEQTKNTQNQNKNKIFLQLFK